MMDASELNLSVNTMARSAPRSFNIEQYQYMKQEVSEPNYYQNSNNTISSHIHKNIDSESQILLQNKLKSDQTITLQQQEEEIKIRIELERSKQSLIDNYQLNENRLLAQLQISASKYEQIMLEKDILWNDKLKQKDNEIDKIEKRINQIIEQNNTKMSDKEKQMIIQLEKQEITWKNRLSEIERKHKEYVQSLHSKYSIERDAKELTEKAKIDAKEEQFKHQFEKKIKKYEMQIEDIIKKYHDKELIIQGSLDEARREIIHLKCEYEAKQQSLRDELSLKDKRLLMMQSNLVAIDEITHIADAWRLAAKDLSAMVVQACVTVQDLPLAPVPPKDLFTSLFQGFAKEEELNKHKLQYNIELKAYNRLRRTSVVIHKEFLSKALRNSKRIIERVKAEVVPSFNGFMDES